MIPICSASLKKVGELWKNVEISWYFKGPAQSAFFLEISWLLWMGSHFTCMFLMMIPKNLESLMKVGELWKNVEISWYFKGPAQSAFFLEISWLLWMGSHFTCMFLMMIPKNLESLMKFGELWIIMKFYDISRTGTGGIFLWNKLTSLYGHKFHMHVSDDDSNIFCKFDEIWWTLKKCWNFMIFWRAGSVSIFLLKIELLWIGWNFTCMFLMMIPICSASLMKFGELWKNVEIW